MTTLVQVSNQQAHAVTVNDNFEAVSASALFGVKESLTTGLTFAYYGGIIGGFGAFTVIADGTVALTGSATNYIEATTAGVVSKNTSAFTAGQVPLYTAVTSASAITTLTDYRVQSASFFAGGLSLNTLTLTRQTVDPAAPAATKGIFYLKGATDAAIQAYFKRPDATVLQLANLNEAQTFAGAITLTSAAPQLILGVNITTLGSIKLFGNTSGDATIRPAAVAGTATVITLPATSVTLNAAGDLTGTTLAAGVVTSSLTSVGTITALQATAIGSVTPGTGAFTTLNATGNTILTGQVALGTVNVGNQFFRIAPTFTAADASGASLGVNLFDGTINVFAGANGIVISVGGVLVEASSGNHAMLAGMRIQPPSITPGAATVTNAATLWITGPPTVTVSGANYSVQVDSGITALGGNVRIGSTTAPTVALDVTGAVLISTTLGVNGGTLSTTATTFTGFAGATTLLTIGGTGATSVFAIPGTLEATGTTGALTVAGGVYIAKASILTGTVTLGGAIVGPATATVFNTVSTTVNAFGAATTLTLGAGTGTITLGAAGGTNAVTIPGTLTLTATATPTGAGTGAVGQIAWDTAYLYICTATNDWRRVALTDF